MIINITIDRFNRGKCLGGDAILYYHDAMYATRDGLPASFRLSGDIGWRNNNGHLHNSIGPARTEISNKMVFAMNNRVMSRFEVMIHEI